MACRIACFTSQIGGMNVQFGGLARVQMHSRGIIITCLLSPSPWSTLGGWDKASAGILVFPRIY